MGIEDEKEEGVQAEYTVRKRARKNMLCAPKCKRGGAIDMGSTDLDLDGQGKRGCIRRHIRLKDWRVTNSLDCRAYKNNNNGKRTRGDTFPEIFRFIRPPGPI